MLKHNIINPLNVHNLRKLEFCPPHFTKVIFDLYTSEKEIIDWIYENLSDRFYVGPLDVPQDSNGPIVRKTLVAFESPGEASFFSMFLPEINQFRWSL